MAKKQMARDIENTILKCLARKIDNPDQTLKDCLEKNRDFLMSHNRNGALMLQLLDDDVKSSIPVIVHTSGFGDYMQVAVQNMNLEGMKILYDSGIFDFHLVNYYKQMCPMLTNVEEEKQRIREMFEFVESKRLSAFLEKQSTDPLHLAILWNNAFMVDLITKACPESLKHVDKEGKNAAIFAARSAHSPAVLRILTNRGADFIHRNGDMVPINEALNSGNAVAAEFIMRLGADVNIADKHGNIAAHYVTTSLLPKNLCDEIVEKTENINKHNNLGSTPLHNVFRHKGAHRMIEPMLNKGADLDIEDMFGSNPVADSFHTLTTEEIRELYREGYLDFNYHNLEGKNYMMLMLDKVRSDYLPDLIAFAVEHDWDITETDKKGRDIIDCLPRTSNGRLASGYKKIETMLKEIIKEHTGAQTEYEDELCTFGF